MTAGVRICTRLISKGRQWLTTVPKPSTSSEAVIVKLVSLEQHAQQLLEATWRSDWLRAEFELNGVRMCLVAVTELAQLANDIQRGQIR